ncbi:MAG TPA: hypothetical protein VI277_06045 [Candidatus Limnocylindria bacterium]
MPHLPDHTTHDPELIAAYAAGDATGPDLALATELVADCTDCAALHRDLRSIATALPELPAPARSRDFRLTPEQAAALAPSGWRGFLAAFASPRFRLAAPLGTGLAAIGLAGLLLGTPGSVLPAGEGSAAGSAAGATPSAPAPEKAEDGSVPTIDAAAPAAGAGLAEAAASQPAAMAPQVVPAASADAFIEPDRASVTETGSGAAEGRSSTTSIEQGPPQGAGEPAGTDLSLDAREGDNAREIAPSDAAVIQPAGSPAIALLGVAALIAGVVLVALRLGAKRLV